MDDRTTNVLLVEDDEVDIMNVRRAFERNCISNPLYVARNGLEALDMLKGGSSQQPTVPRDRRIILLDINMPRMNGIEFLQELRTDSHLRLIPVVVLTTSNADQDRIEAYKFNVAGYILKPVSFDTFVDVLAVLNHYWTLSEMP